MEESPSGAGSHKRTRPVEAAGAADAQTRPPRLGKHCAFSPSFHRALPHHKHTQRKTRKSTGHWASWSPFSQFRTHMNFRRAIFLRHFQRVATSGDAIEHLEFSARSVRENRIAKAVQTAVHWLAEAARTLEDEFRLLPVWTALEAVLCAIEYPPIFDKRYVHIKKALRTAIDDIYDDEDKTDKAGIVRDLLKGRLLNNTWPIPTRLELFAKTFGVTLHEGDTEVVKRLGRIRGQVVHTGGQRADGLGCEIAQLKYVVERMIMAASVCGVRVSTGDKNGSPKVHVGPELAEGAPGGPVTGAFPGFSLGVLVMGQGPVEARGKRAVFSKARWARLCVRGAGSFHRACPFVTSGPRGALFHLPRVQLVKSRCPYDLRCTCVIFQPERWGPNSQTLAPLRVRAHRGDHAL